MKTCYAALLLFLFIGCQRGGESASGTYDEAVEAGEAQFEEMQASRLERPGEKVVAATTTPRQTEPKLIKTADVGMEVADYAAAREDVDELAERFDAYVASEEERRHPGQITGTLTLRVAAAQFDVLLSDLVAIAQNVDYRTVNVQDVTEEFVDVSARLRARRAVEARYLALLEEAKTVEDILRVEQSLGNVRVEIERAEGRLNYLEDRIGFSTINLNLYERIEGGAIASGPGFFRQVGRAFGNGWDGLKMFVLGLVNLWPLLLLIALIVPAVRVYRQRRHAARADAA